MMTAIEDRSSVSQPVFDSKGLAIELWAKKWVILCGGLIAGLLSFCFTLLMPTIFRAEALLAPAEYAGRGNGALIGRLDGLASLAGFDIADDGKVSLALEVLKSRKFLNEFIERRGILVDLMAIKQWDAKANKLIIDSDKYNVGDGQWVKSEEGLEEKPTKWDAYRRFSKVMKVTNQKDTGFVHVSVEHQSPLLAQQWVGWLIEDLNSQMRAMDIDEAEKNIEYLKQEMEKTSIAEMQKVFYQLIEKQMQTIMLANVRDQYVLRMIDPPLQPEEPVSPKRIVIVLSLSMVGLLFVVIFYAVRFFYLAEVLAIDKRAMV